jgi:hypothetical protein
MAVTPVVGSCQHPGGIPVAGVPVYVDLVANSHGAGGDWGQMASINTTIGGEGVVETNAFGLWTMSLQPNSLITTPPGTVYRVREFIDPDKPNLYYILVPNTSGGTVFISNILTNPPGALGASGSPGGRRIAAIGSGGALNQSLTVGTYNDVLPLSLLVPFGLSPVLLKARIGVIVQAGDSAIVALTNSSNQILAANNESWVSGALQMVTVEIWSDLIPTPGLVPAPGSAVVKVRVNPSGGPAFATANANFPGFISAQEG